MHKRQKIGEFAENLAMDFLIEKGDKIVQKNYRKPWGEIDIITERGDKIVFVEVKANSQDFVVEDFSPEYRVDDQKLEKIIKTAKMYLESNKEKKWQVDIISVTFIRSEKKAKIMHFKNVVGDWG